MKRAGKSSKPRAKKAAAKPRNTRKRLQLPEVLDLTAAAPLAQSFMSHRGKPLSVDASRVNRVGAQCLQVLLAATSTWRNDGASISLVKPSDAFLEGGRLLGIHLDQEFSGREKA